MIKCPNVSSHRADVDTGCYPVAIVSHVQRGQGSHMFEIAWENKRTPILVLSQTRAAAPSTGATEPL